MTAPPLVEHSFGQEDVEMGSQLEGGSEALQEREGSNLRLLDSQPTGRLALEAKERAHEDAEDFRQQR